MVKITLSKTPLLNKECSGATSGVPKQNFHLILLNVFNCCLCCSEKPTTMFCDEDFDYGALLDDDFLSVSSPSNKKRTAKGETSLHSAWSSEITVSQFNSIDQAHGKISIIKSASGTESVLRMRRKIFRPKDGRIDNNAAVNSIQCRQYLRRRQAGNSSRAYKLYAFPTFDKCDSLLFIPTSIAALCNCGDMPALSKLLHSRASKDCRIKVDVLSDDDMSPDFYVKMQGIIVETHPDIILCVHSTKVIENQIIASAVIKFTASTAMHKSIARVKKDPTFDPLFSVEREQSLRHMILREDIPEHERVQFYALLDTDLDLVIHKKTEMVLTFNDTTKKLTRMSMKCRLTAIEVIPRQIGFAE